MCQTLKHWKEEMWEMDQCEIPQQKEKEFVRFPH